MNEISIFLITKKKKSTKSLDSFHIHFRDQQGRREQIHSHRLHPECLRMN